MAQPVPGEEPQAVTHLVCERGGVHCGVYFFKSWKTYSHPVTPVDPILLDEALRREWCYRGWMTLDGADRFVGFEKVRSIREPTQLDAGADRLPWPCGYLAQYVEDDLAVGPNRALGDLLYAHEYLVQTDPAERSLVRVKQSIVYSYDYTYEPDGRLKEIVVTNAEGQRRVMKG